MDSGVQMRPELLLPEILVFVGGFVVLLGGSFLPRERQSVARTAAALILFGAAVAAALAMAGPARPRSPEPSTWTPPPVPPG